MMIRNAKPAANSQVNEIDISSAFQAPTAYLNGERKILKDARSNDWWLNIDYVTVEVAA